MGREPQRNGRKTRDSINGKRNHFLKRVVAFPRMARLSFIWKGCLREADPAHHTPDETIAFRHGVELFNDPSAHKPEITGIARNLNIDQLLQRAVEYAC